MDTKKCPYCGKELPQEMNFCPYCMEKLADEKTALPISGNKHRLSKKGTIAVIAAAVLLLALAAALLITHFAGDTSELSSGASESDSYSESQIQGESDTDDISVSETEKTSASEESGAPSDAPTDKIQPPKSGVAAEQMVSRWNAAKQKLYIYNYTLDYYYIPVDSDENAVISQTFNNNGVFMQFNYKKDLSSFTLEAANIENLNDAYNLTAISLAAVTENYSYAFINFMTDAEWVRVDSQTLRKTDEFFGYNCIVTMKIIEKSDEWGTPYKRYECILSAEKK